MSGLLVILAIAITVFAAVILGSFLYAAGKGLTFREAWQAWQEAVDHEYREHPTTFARLRKRWTRKQQ